MSWKISVFAAKDIIQAALIAHEDALDWDDSVVLSGSEIADDKPDDWVLEAWFAEQPGKAGSEQPSVLFVGRPGTLDQTIQLAERNRQARAGPGNGVAIFRARLFGDMHDLCFHILGREPYCGAMFDRRQPFGHRRQGRLHRNRQLPPGRQALDRPDRR